MSRDRRQFFIGNDTKLRLMKERDGRSDKQLRCARVIRDTLTMLERAFVQRKTDTILIIFRLHDS